MNLACFVLFFFFTQESKHESRETNGSSYFLHLYKSNHTDANGTWLHSYM